MTKKIDDFLKKELSNIEQAGLMKQEFLLKGRQGPHIKFDEKKFINLCSSDYLGLLQDERIARAVKDAADKYGLGLCSSRVVCGTMDIHKELEQEISTFLQTEATILYNSGYEAHIGLFESLFNEEDMLFVDNQIQTSLLEGMLLCSAKRYFYRTHHMDDLQDKLKRSRQARFRAIVTDGVTDMDGKIAHIGEICQHAETYDAIVILADFEGIGVIGEHGKGTAEFREALGKVDVITGTFDRALGGLSCGFISGRKDIITWLKQRSRTYLFSASLNPAVAAGAKKALSILEEGPDVLLHLHENVGTLRKKLKGAGLSVMLGSHPIISVVVRDAVTLQKMTDLLFREGIFVMGFCYPVVPKESARIRLQVTALHTEEQLDKVISAFTKAGKELKIVK